MTRLLAWSVAPKAIYLGSDLLALTLAHWLALGLVEHFLNVAVSAQNPFQYHRFYIPFFAVALYLFEGYKHTELRRPERELGRSREAVSVNLLGLEGSTNMPCRDLSA